MKAFFYKLSTFCVIVSLLFASVPPQVVSALPAVADPRATLSSGDHESRSAQVQSDDSRSEVIENIALENQEPVSQVNKVRQSAEKTVRASTIVADSGQGQLSSSRGDWQVSYRYHDLPTNVLALQSAGVPEHDFLDLGYAGIGYTLKSEIVSGTQPLPLFDNSTSFDFEITAQYTQDDIWGLDESSLGLYWQDPETKQWQRLPTLLNTLTQELVAYADQLGKFAVFGQLKVQQSQEAEEERFKLVLDPDDDVGYANWPGYGRISELPYNVQLATQVRDRLVADSCNVDVLLTREAASPRFLSRTTRASMARDFEADMFVTLAFNALTGSPWGRSGDGGIEAWARLSNAEDTALVNQFYARIKEYTGRPQRKATMETRYSDFSNLPSSMTYAHIETLFLDHNYDWPVIRDKFEYISDGAYAAIRTRLEAQGMTCLNEGGEVNPLPAPPSAEMLKRLRDLGYQNYQKYGADPVSFSTGNHIISQDLFSLPGHGGMSFDFSLVYNSQDDRLGYFGIGWSSPIAFTQRYSDESVSVTLFDGRTYYFPFNGAEYDIPQDLKITFSRTSDGWEWVEQNGIRMTFVEANDGFGVITRLQDRRGLEQVYEYDFGGESAVRPQLLSITDSTGRAIEFESDENGYITKIDLPDGRDYQFGYDNGRLIEIKHANGGSYKFEYDARGRIVKEWDPEGILFLQVKYDDRDRVIEQLDANGVLLWLEYEPGVTTYSDNLGNTTQYFFDDENRVTSVKDALGHSTGYEYDERNNIVAYVDERGNRFEYQYDASNNLVQETGPENYFKAYTYNSFGDLLSITDNGGTDGQARTIVFTVNSFGDVERVAYPDGSSLQMTYDPLGNIKTLTNQNGFTDQYEYNQFGLPVRIVNHAGDETKIEYDAAGRITKLTDANTHSMQFRYDKNSNVTRIIDPKGNPTIFEYDKNDNLVVMKDRRGSTWRFAYNDDLKLISETDPEGYVTRYGYDLMYNLASITDPRGNITRFEYNARYEIERVVAANGGVTRFEYDPAGNLVHVVDALDRVTKFEYNGLGMPIAQINADDNRVEFVYDEVGRLIELTNPRGAKTFFTYDVLDQLVEMRDALDGIWKMSYDFVGNPIELVDANGRVSRMEYDSNDQMVSFVDADNNVTRFEFDRVGNQTKVIDALERATSFTYDENGNLRSIRDALTGLTEFSYDAEDNLTSMKDALGNLTRFEYDRNSLLVKMIEAGNQVSRFEYDGAQNLTGFTNAKNKSWEYIYDKLNLLTAEKDPLDHTTVYGYDILGRLTRMVDANNIATGYEYDVLDRLSAVIQNQTSGAANAYTNVTTQYIYDEVDNLTGIIDANGKMTSFAYDLLDRVIKETNALDNTWQYEYDPVGNLIKRTDANEAVTLYTYTVTDFLERTDYPDGSFIAYEYDAVGNQRSAHASWLGTVSNAYDALDRLVTTTDHAGRMLRYYYDAVGNQTGVTYPDGKVVQYAYNSDNYLTQITDPEGGVFDIARDPTHNVIRVENPNGTAQHYEFDAAERLASVSNTRPNGTLINKFAYELDAVGNRTQVDALNVVGGTKLARTISQYEYDPLYRLTGSRDNTGAFSQYTYDAVGNRLKLVTNFDPMRGLQRETLTYNYSYDDINALISITEESTWRDLSGVSAQLNGFINEVQAQSGKGIETQTADELIKSATTIVNLIGGAITDEMTLEERIENLRAQVQTALEEDKIKSTGVANSLLVKIKDAKDTNKNKKPDAVNEMQFDYDKNGNRIARWVPNTPSNNGWVRTDYTYDFENRLVNVQDFRVNNINSNAKGQPGQEARMVYDAYGRLFERRLDKRLGGGGDVHATQFVYDGLDPVVEYHEPSGLYTNFYRGEGRILSMLTNAGAGYADGRIRYFHYDGLNSTTALSGHRGQSLHTYRYSDFGTILDNNGRSQDASNFTDPHNHYTYTGQEWEENTGLFHFYAREYDASTGTWLQQDPYRGQLQLPITLHRYGYVSNNPIIFFDEYGYAIQAILVAAMPFVVAGGLGAVSSVGARKIGDTISKETSTKSQYKVSAVAGFIGGVISMANPSLGGAVDGFLESVFEDVVVGKPVNISKTIFFTGLGAVTSMAGNKVVRAIFPKKVVGRIATRVSTYLISKRMNRVVAEEAIDAAISLAYGVVDNLTWEKIEAWLKSSSTKVRFSPHCGCTPPPEIPKLIQMGYSLDQIRELVRQVIYQRGSNARKGNIVY